MNGITPSALRKGIVAVLAVFLLPAAAANAGFLDKLKSAVNNLPTNADDAKKVVTDEAKKVATDSVGNAASPAAAAQSAAAQNARTASTPAAAADISMPPAMAELMKAIPDLSAGAFKLGMPRDEAIAKLKATGFFAETQAKSQISFKFQQLPNHTFIGGSMGQKDGPGTHFENVYLTYTTEPAKPVVAEIQREVGYDRSEAPSLVNTLAALRQKYGPESGGNPPGELYWFFDYRGRRLSTAQAAQLQQDRCATGLQDGGSFSRRLSNPARAIGMGYAGTSGGVAEYANHHQAPGCFAVIHVVAGLGTRTPSSSGGSSNTAATWAAHSTDIVGTITVTIRDLPLENSVYTATRNMVLHGGEQQAQQEINQAKKNKPDL